MDILDLAAQHTKACLDAAAKESKQRRTLAISGLTFRKGKEIESHSAGVHPRQAKEAERMSAIAGVPTHFNSNGLPVFTSYRHRDKYLKAKGWVVYDKE